MYGLPRLLVLPKRNTHVSPRLSETTGASDALVLILMHAEPRRGGVEVDQRRIRAVGSGCLLGVAVGVEHRAPDQVAQPFGNGLTGAPSTSSAMRE